MIYQLKCDTKMYERLISNTVLSNGRSRIVEKGTLVVGEVCPPCMTRVCARVLSGPDKGFMVNAAVVELNPVSPLKLLALEAE